MNRLQGRCAIVTGAGSGIGRAIALGYAAEGAQVVCADINAATAQKTAGEISAGGGQALAVEVDVSRRDQVQALVSSALSAFGRIHVLLAAAGIGPVAPFLDLEGVMHSEEELLLPAVSGFEPCVQPRLVGRISGNCGPSGHSS